MKQKIMYRCSLGVLASFIALAGCSKDQRDQAEQLKQRANEQANALKERGERTADSLQKQADATRQKADQQAGAVREGGEQKAEAMREREQQGGSTPTPGSGNAQSARTGSMSQGAGSDGSASGTAGESMAQGEAGRSGSLGRGEILSAQKELKEMGHYGGKADGIAGPLTREAVKRFQKEENLAVTGKLDSKTLSQLKQKAG